MSLPSIEELSILPRFRIKVGDVLTEEQRNDDMFLLRWLRARELNEVAAENMLRNAMKWRRENNLDTMIVGEASKPFYYENFPKWLEGVDKEGRPILLSQFGKWDVRRVPRGGKEEFVAYMAECLEEISRTIQTSSVLHPPQPGSPRVTQFVGAIDWKGFAWGQLFNYQAVQNLLQGASIYEAYFPEILHSFYFVNCPSLISTVMMLLKPILAPKTMSKIKVFGKDRKAWEEELLKNIDASQLRPEFGGTKDTQQN